MTLTTGTIERRVRRGVRNDRPTLRVVRAEQTQTRRRQTTRAEAIPGAPSRDALALAAVVAAFCAFGLVMVLSSSSVASISSYGSPWSVVERQVLWTVVGGFAFVVTAKMSLQFWRRVAVPLVVSTAGLLFAVLVPHIGKVAGGSSRWIGFGLLRIQPSELAKLAVVLFVADLVARRKRSGGEPVEVVRPVVIVLAALAILIVRQPDLGTAAVVVCVGAVLLYAGGVPLKKVATLAAIFGTLGGAFLLVEPYGRARIAGFLDPFGHASTSGYQVVQSLVTLGSGHVLGTGLGGSSAAWGFLPNASNDFIFAIVGNNFGLVGALGVLLGFLALGWLGIRVAARAQDRFASLVAAGITTWIVVQALINMGGVTGAVPETGIPLPFLSSGGSSLVVLLAATGILVRIARHPDEKTRTTLEHDRLRRRAAAGR
ncbi:MAG TPA: putative lipid II flippase FtsW [Acidimicrobiales bacterium]|nr:putative lipid II flippase FtsW [Acidimicrobiales bacterium]